MPVDRWAQAKDARDLLELLDNIGPLVDEYGVTLLVDPFGGLGSGALAARHLGLRYLGAEISPVRAGHAMTKAFLTLPLLENLLVPKNLQAGPPPAAPPPAAPPPTAPPPAGHTRGGVEASGPSLEEAVKGTIEHIAARLGSMEDAVSLMVSDLAAAPPPCRGEIHAGDFRRLRPDPGADDVALYHLCPPFPRHRPGGTSTDPPKDVGHCRAPEEFEELLRETVAWLRDHVRPGDVVVSEYFNFVPDYDTGTRTADLLADALPFLRVVPASTRDQRGAEAAHSTGYCGFILGSTARLPQVPAPWFPKGEAHGDLGATGTSAAEAT